MTRIKRQKNEAWEKVTAEELFDLSFRQNKLDSAIAAMYNVTPEQVSYKRNKFNLKHALGSLAYRRLTAESMIGALAVSCGISEEYKQKYIDLTTDYFKGLMRSK